MIKRYILHIEFHWGYWPRISIKRVPRPGDWVFDGGEWGQLVICRECSGDGLLHLVKPKQYMQAKPESLWPERTGTPSNLIFEGGSDHRSAPAMDFNADTEAPETAILELGPRSLDYKVGEVISYWRTSYLVESIEWDGIKRKMHLRKV